MTKMMLIDAAHAEETRVVVVDGQRIEELDFESQSRKQLRGNIYLAKVTRVEPSLQAAFIEYGGNRHGFLAFNEIHPDYYQIPMADREALMREEAEEEDEPPIASRSAANRGDSDEEGGEDETSHAGAPDDDDEDDVMEQELERRRRRLMRRYKIQEVIRRRQIMLVQVVKEERGNKGAALTTYLSLAGRYCVLMPNTARGGGISRKITNAPDRKRLKAVAQGLDVPQGMGLIVRTAGAARTKVEIKRDYEYLLRMWENIRETTLQSIAPALIYAEEDLVKRAIRDMFDKDLDGIVVEGEAGYREARDFMRMLMPSQAKKIQAYREPTPLFVKYKIEDQLAQLHSPVVPLRSGGYIVINQTEALVAVDVNSGKSTRERNIEATALKTNMEAAEETARQVRLRDLAGLIVIDFIDMDEGKNNRAVEKKLKESLADDRARIQMGKISPFGLMEISRQRRRSGVLEGTTHVCEHCQGTGRIRSVESSALAALRTIEVEAARGGAGAVTIRLTTAIALYILNEKRNYLARLEQTHDLIVTIATDDHLGHTDVDIERTEAREPSPDRLLELQPTARGRGRVLEPELAPDDDFVIEADEDDDDDEVVDTAESGESDSRDPGSRDPGRREAAAEEADSGRRRKRRRRGRRDDRDDRGPQPSLDVAGETDEEEDEELRGTDDGAEGAGSEAEREARRGRRRRGRRGGRRVREDGRPADTYAWVHAHPSRHPHASEDPYAWRDPHALGATREDRTIEAQAERMLSNAASGLKASAELQAATGPSADPQTAAETGAADPYAWTSAADDAGDEAMTGRRRERVRRGRGRRGRNDDRGGAEVEVAAEVVEAEVSAEPPAPEPHVEAANVRQVEPEADLTTESQAEMAEESPALLVAPPPAEEPTPSEPEPDPNEISTPPATPKRGWWRR
jgi:ribonuclease E